MTDQSQLIQSLQKADVYPHLAANIEIIETHISWVILTGIFAYKIKKELTLSFLDFGTLQNRKHFCEEEMRLNRRWAPDLYLDVVPICGSAERPSFGGGGPVIEYALKLRQFPQQAQLDRQLDAGHLGEADMHELAETIATMHGNAARVVFPGAEPALQQVGAPMLENFSYIGKTSDLLLVRRLESWTRQSLENLHNVLISRHQDGYVRECHGDLHLKNLVRLSSGIVPFDGIEFSESLRNIDVISDITFLVMDLVARARQDLASVFVNRYLERSGDYSGMATFGLYFVYHCLVLAKVAAIRSTERAAGPEQDADIATMKHYLVVAARWIRQGRPILIVMHGLSGSGKTWLSSKLLSALPAIRIRSDVERRRSFGLAASVNSGSAPGEGIYTDQAKSSVYRQLFQMAGRLLQSGFNVIIDASFLQKAARDDAAACAQTHQSSLVIVETVAQEATLFDRVRRRKASRTDASEAGSAVLEYQQLHSEPITRTERKMTLSVATDKAVDVDRLVKDIRGSAFGPGHSNVP
jgi:aminoglycoside phosphotransferase family enzyme/predicted kinase